ncbi:MAG: hypothetical protein ACT4QD_15540 [Acidobacteriota bacterium]
MLADRSVSEWCRAPSGEPPRSPDRRGRRGSLQRSVPPIAVRPQVFDRPAAELPHAVAVQVGYIGSRSERLDIGGTGGFPINLNQLDPRFQSLGTALQEQVPNPFFGNPAFGPFNTRPTLSRGQLLRPYPQFDGVFAHQVDAGSARYHSLVLDVARRLRDGWSLRANYTWSRTEDNIVGEFNSFSPRGAATPLDNGDLDREFGVSLGDTPHRLNLSGTIELPFGEGKRWLDRPGVLAALAGGWAVTVVGAYQSGFPIRIVQANNNSRLLGSGQRPNLAPGVDPRLTTTPRYDRACFCVRWLNPAAWSPAAPFTCGNAPRVDARVRTPSRHPWDLAVEKRHRAGGRTIAVRAEVINVVNRPEYAGPDINFGNSRFGWITSEIGFPRTLQLQARVSW